MTHELKIKSFYLEQLVEGSKKSEVRFNDRDYQKGDILSFSHYDENDIQFEVTHVLHYPEGLKEGYVVLSVKNI